MRYGSGSWSLDGVRRVHLVEELRDAGLEPAGCLVNDLSPDRDHRMLRGYDEDVRAFLLERMGGSYPILLSPDHVVAVEVSDMYGWASVRMRTILLDGTLVETHRRWEDVPPWPGRLAPFRRFATVEREMSRSVAPGRTLVISDRPPAGQLEEHRRQVQTIAAALRTTPRPFPDMEGVAEVWTAAFAHDEAVTRRTDTLIAALLVVLVLVLTWFAPGIALRGPWWPLEVFALIMLVWWALPGPVVLLRRWITWRPAFRLGAHGVP